MLTLRVVHDHNYVDIVGNTKFTSKNTSLSDLDYADAKVAHNHDYNDVMGDAPNDGISLFFGYFVP